MAFYVDSAYLDDITTIIPTVPVAGVTTNPTLLLEARQRGQRLEVRELLTQLLQHVNGTIFMQPSLVNEAQAYREMLDFININAERIIPKIPMSQVGMHLARHLHAEGYHIAFTAVITVAQAYAANAAGAEYIIPYYNRLRRNGIDPSERISQMAQVLARQPYPTRILAASIKSSSEATEALLSGAHDLTLPPACLLDMLKDPQSDEAIARFEQDWQKMNSL
jgi:TalC/MipB family fructose-6-phosphate aldolase